MVSTCKTPLTDLDPIAKDCFKLIYGLECVFGTLLNATVLGIFIKDRNLWSFSNANLMSLIISDFILSAILSPFALVRLSLPKGDPRLCAVNKVTLVLSSLLATSALTVSAIAYDRYLCISKADHYLEYMSTWRKIFLIVFPWLAPLVIIPARLADDRTFTWILFGMYVVGYSLMISSYLLMIVALNKRIDRLKQSGLHESENRNLLAIVRQNQKATRMTFMIICTFMLCTLCTFLYRVLLTINIFMTDGWEFFNDNGPLVHSVGIALFKLNSALNPIIYFRRHQAIKQALKKLLYGKRKQNVCPPNAASKSTCRRVRFQNSVGLQLRTSSNAI